MREMAVSRKNLLCLSFAILSFGVFLAGCKKEEPSRAKARSAKRSAAPPRESSGAARLAVIIDDMGNDRAAADALLALPFPLTISVLPDQPLSTDVANEAARRGDQVMLHLPMQSESATADEPVELRVGMPRAKVESLLGNMLATVPHVSGVNNHEGSLATSDKALMDELMPALRQRNLFFIDSRTAASTVAYDEAHRLGVRAASRKVFLDDSLSEAAIRQQLELAEEDAIHNGEAIAIGHPHPETIAALRQALPNAKKQGIQLVFASELVH